MDCKARFSAKPSIPHTARNFNLKVGAKRTLEHFHMLRHAALLIRLFSAKVNVGDELRLKLSA